MVRDKERKPGKCRDRSQSAKNLKGKGPILQIFLMWKNNFKPLLNSFSRQAVHEFGPISLDLTSTLLPLKCLFPLILYLQFYVMKPKGKIEVDTL